MGADDLWLASAWPFIGASVPPAPASVLEIGCGPLGGFVPQLLAQGYDAIGVDPRAPATPSYHRSTFEQYDPPQRFDAVVASTSLHHVTGVDAVVDRIAGVLTAEGVVVVVEWAWERLDEATARWCFARLAPDREPSWLAQRRNEWRASEQPWDVYFPAWASRQGLHASDKILRSLDRRFDRQVHAVGPYCFPDLKATTESEDQAAINNGTIRPTAVRYVGRRL